jgi:hypothetical protein
MKRIVLKLFIACAVIAPLLFPMTLIVVTPVGLRPLLVQRMAQDDTVTLAHINSIYREPVEEVLKLKGDTLLLDEVRTSSYGVKEYYRITEGIRKIGYKQFRFNNAHNAFTLAVKGRRVEAVASHPDVAISVQIARRPLVRYLWWIVASR